MQNRYRTRTYPIGAHEGPQAGKYVQKESCSFCQLQWREGLSPICKFALFAARSKHEICCNRLLRGDAARRRNRSFTQWLSK